MKDQNRRKKIAMSYSGGLDRAIMYHMAKIQNPDAEIKAVYWDHGQPNAQREIAGLPDFVEIRKVDWLGKDKQPVTQPGRREGAIMIPGRNLVFATLLACQELADEIWIGALQGELHLKGTDKNRIFQNLTSGTLSYVLSPWLPEGSNIVFPLADAKLDKLGEVKWALENGLTKEDLLKTRSCHSGDTERCGECIQCVKRWAVFGECGFSEDYDIHPLDSDFGKQFVYDLVNCALGNDDYYDETTRAEMMPYILRTFRETPELYELRTRKLLEELTSKAHQ
jgi:7-cyano-7-deazaguanine synthase in queuosine biosynthesis